MWILKILQLLTKPPKRKRPKPGVAEHRIAKTPFVYDPGLWFFKVPRVCGRAFSIRLMLPAGFLSVSWSVSVEEDILFCKLWFLRWLVRFANVYGFCVGFNLHFFQLLLFQSGQFHRVHKQ